MLAVDVSTATPVTYPLSTKSSAVAPSLTNKSPNINEKAKPTSNNDKVNASGKDELQHKHSLLFPADRYQELVPGVKLISAHQLSLAYARLTGLSMPSTETVFPWLYDIDCYSDAQMKHFGVKDIGDIKPPTTYRGITIVHSSNASSGRLVGSVPAHQLVEFDGTLRMPYFARKPRDYKIDELGLRNFGSQIVRTAMISDIVVYDPSKSGTGSQEAIELAQKCVAAQRIFRKSHSEAIPQYNTFLVTDDLRTFEQDYPHLVAQSRDSDMTVPCTDLYQLERQETRLFTAASEIDTNVFLGNRQDWQDSRDNDQTTNEYDIHIDCDEDAEVPAHLPELKFIRDSTLIEFKFPSSMNMHRICGKEVDKLIAFCAWIYKQANHKNPDESSSTYLDLLPKARRARKVLISCVDGYTESTLFALTYLVYAKCKSLEDTFIYLHKVLGRDFNSDKRDSTFLRGIHKVLVEASISTTKATESVRASSIHPLSPWYAREGVCRALTTLPSRITDYLYLGNIDHANNVNMLQDLDIDRILSIGERPEWCHKVSFMRASTTFDSHFVKVYDNGISPISPHIEECLSFIDKGLKEGRKTLVHCRVGVSRSASICIAEIIRRKCMSLEQAYIFVRARRLSVIIQPTLLFMYELLRWEQQERTRRSGQLLSSPAMMAARTVEWPTLASRIGKINSMYAMQPSQPKQ